MNITATRLFLAELNKYGINVSYVLTATANRMVATDKWFEEVGRKELEEHRRRALRNPNADIGPLPFVDIGPLPPVYVKWVEFIDATGLLQEGNILLTKDTRDMRKKFYLYKLSHKDVNTEMVAASSQQEALDAFMQNHEANSNGSVLISNEVSIEYVSEILVAF